MPRQSGVNREESRTFFDVDIIRRRETGDPLLGSWRTKNLK